MKTPTILIQECPRCGYDMKEVKRDELVMTRWNFDFDLKTCPQCGVRSWYQDQCRGLKYVRESINTREEI